MSLHTYKILARSHILMGPLSEFGPGAELAKFPHSNNAVSQDPEDSVRAGSEVGGDEADRGGENQDSGSAERSEPAEQLP
jgi:hypothetical protein